MVRAKMNKAEALNEATYLSQSNLPVTIYMDPRTGLYDVQSNCGGVQLPEMVDTGCYVVAPEKIAAALERAEARFSQGSKGFHSERL